MVPLIFFAAAAVGVIPENGVLFSSSLQKGFSHLEQAWRSDRAEIVFEDGSRVHNCEQYVKAPGDLLESVSNQIAKANYLECDVLALFKNVKRLESGVPTTFAGQQLYNKLDLRTLPTSLNQLADDSSFSFGQISEIPARVEQNAVVSDTDDWLLQIEVVAAIDLNGNGEADWIVWMTDEAKDGNYRSYQTFVIYDPQHSKILRAVKLDRKRK